MFQFDQKLCGSGSIRGGFTAMALYHKPLGRLSRAPEARALAEAFPCGAPPCRARRPAEVLMPLVEFCLKRTTSKMNQTAKGQPPGKKGQPLFSYRSFYSPWCLPPLIPCVLFPSKSSEEIFHGIWTGKSGSSQSIKRMWSKNWIWLLGKRGSLIILMCCSHHIFIYLCILVKRL